MKENSELWYRVNLRVSQIMLNHNQNLFFLIFVCLVSLEMFILAHLHSAERALSSPSRCFESIVDKS